MSSLKKNSPTKGHPVKTSQAKEALTMNSSPAISREWYQDWEPSRRPIQLQVPLLSYDSLLEVWQERVRAILRHAAVSGFIETPLPLNKLDTDPECWAAATYCLVLLESSISERILGDILILSVDSKLTNDPYILFAQVERLANAVHAAIKHCNPSVQSRLWNGIRGKKGYRNIHELANDLNITPRREYTGADYCNFVLVAAMLVKRHFPAHQRHTIQQLANKALTLGSTPQLGEKDWGQMKDDLGRVPP